MTYLNCCSDLCSPFRGNSPESCHEIFNSYYEPYGFFIPPAWFLVDSLWSLNQRLSILFSFVMLPGVLESLVIHIRTIHIVVIDANVLVWLPLQGLRFRVLK